MLRDICNLVIIMGNRDDIDSMATGSASVLTTVLKLVDKFDLYGSVAYPKRHSQADVSDIYHLPYATRCHPVSNLHDFISFHDVLELSVYKCSVATLAMTLQRNVSPPRKLWQLFGVNFHLLMATAVTNDTRAGGRVGMDGIGRGVIAILVCNQRGLLQSGFQRVCLSSKFSI